MENNGRILIIGACGFVGSRMYRILGHSRAIATRYIGDEPNAIYFDALKMDLADAIATPEDISHVMVFYGETHPDVCAADPELSEALNVESTKRVIERLNEWGLPFTFTSSEFVFDGSRGRNRETDPANPINLYGRQKLAIERHLTDVGGRWTIMRLGKVFAANGMNAKLFTGWIDEIESGSVIRVADDQVFSPILVDDVVNGCLSAAEQGVDGLFHLCGLRPCSRLELFELLVDAIRVHRDVKPNVEICSLDDFNLPEPRPKDCSMLPDKIISATGLRITPIEDVCHKIVSEYYSTPE